MAPRVPVHPFSATLGLLSLVSALVGDAGFPWGSMRLPTRVIPLRYHLLIHPNLTTLTFTGNAAIEVMVTRQTCAVILHSKRLSITRATIQAGGGHPGEEARVVEHQPFEQVALLSTEPLRAGHNYTLSIQYHANLSHTFRGFYKSTYRTQEGELRVLAATQFEPTAARMAFPCFDEPAFKARFSIKIRRDNKHLALSNMPVVGGDSQHLTVMVFEAKNVTGKGGLGVQAAVEGGNGDRNMTSVVLWESVVPLLPGLRQN